MKVLVILGAADGAVTTYERARQLGYHTICIDQNPDAPGVSHADEYLQISTRDPHQVAARLAQHRDICGVLAPASDAALPALAWLTTHLGLAATVSEPIVMASVDKSYFRRVIEELGLSPIKSVSGAAGAALARAASLLRFPVLVKPVDSTGSRGVLLVTDPAVLVPALADAVQHSYTGRVIVEEYVSGTHYSVEAVIDRGAPVFCAVSCRTITAAPHFISTSLALPADLSAQVLNKIRQQLATVCARLDYRRGPLNADLVVDAMDAVHLIEVGARVGGNGMAELVAASYGVDILEASIAAAVGAAIRVHPHPPRPALLHVLHDQRSGRLAAVEGVEEVRRHPQVVELRLFAEPGRAVAPYVEAANKLGYVVLAGAEAAQLRRLADDITSGLRWHVDDAPVVGAAP